MSNQEDFTGRVYTALKQGGGLTLAEIAEAAGGTTEQVRLALADLGSDGIRVQADSDGKFSIMTRSFPDFSKSASENSDAAVKTEEKTEQETGPDTGADIQPESRADENAAAGAGDFLSSQERGELPPEEGRAEPAPDGGAAVPPAAVQSESAPGENAGALPTVKEDTAPAVAADGEKEEEENPEEKPMTLMGHLNELRWRLLRCVVAALIGFVACYGVSEDIFGLLMKPLTAALPPDSKLIFTALPEGFFTYLRVAFVAGIFAVSPYIFYQIWAFIAPGLYEEEKHYAIPIAFTSAFFFIGGASFCYFVVFPFAFTFFMGFATDLIQPMPSLGEYLSFALKLLIAFGLIFEMPLFTFFLARMGVLTAAMMRKVRRYAVLVTFIVAAILTPPDVMSQLLMAGPMLLLYELSIVIAIIFGRKPKPKAEPAEENA